MLDQPKVTPGTPMRTRIAASASAAAVLWDIGFGICIAHWICHARHVGGERVSFYMLG
jgi:hypothetical protein